MNHAGPPIIRGESEPIGEPDRGPFYEMFMVWKLLFVTVVCVGGTFAPFGLLAWQLDAFKPGGGTGPGCAVAAIGVLVALTFGIALVQWVFDRQRS